MKIFYPTLLFNGLQVGRSDPFCLKMIGFDPTTITTSLQRGAAAIAINDRISEADTYFTPRLQRRDWSLRGHFVHFFHVEKQSALAQHQDSWHFMRALFML